MQNDDEDDEMGNRKQIFDHITNDMDHHMVTTGRSCTSNS